MIPEAEKPRIADDIMREMNKLLYISYFPSLLFFGIL